MLVLGINPIQTSFLVLRMKRYSPQPIRSITDNCFVFDRLFSALSYVSPSYRRIRCTGPCQSCKRAGNFFTGWGLSTSLANLGSGYTNPGKDATLQLPRPRTVP